MMLHMLFYGVIILLQGHFSNRVTFNATGVAISLVQVFGTSIVQGLCAAIDTLGAQAYGSNDKKKVSP